MRCARSSVWQARGHAHHCLLPVRFGRSDISPAGRRPLFRAALAAILLPVMCMPTRPARAGLNLPLNEFTATRDELQAELSRRFPIMRRYGGLASVSLHNPQLALHGSAHRATLGSRLVIVSLLAATFLRGRAGGCEQWPALGCLGPVRAPPGLARGATALRRRHRKRRTEPGAHQRVHLPGSAASAIRRTRIDGFSLHAAVRCAADDRQVLEQLSRYITPRLRPKNACRPMLPWRSR